MPDVVDLILQDHTELKRLFQELQGQPDRRPLVAPVMSTLLFAHSRAEESEVYPAARAAGIREDVEHSQKEHLAADRLAEDLAAADPASDRFASVLEELVEAVTHHMDEEEQDLLPAMRDALPDEELEDLGRRFLEAREAHLGEQPEDLTRDEMVQQARNAEVEGHTGLGKAELKEKLASEADL